MTATFAASAHSPEGALRIGYYGGSFDPPHRAHLAVACAARDRFALDRVLLAPTGRQPLKPGGALAPYPDRLAMVERLCAGECALEASGLDAPRPDGEPNYTVDALHYLRERLPEGGALFAIVGADALLTLHHWHRAGELFQLAEWIAVSRPGVDLRAQLQGAFTPAERARIHALEGVQDPASATELRERLGMGLACDDLLPASVLAYIRAHHLYGS